MGFFKKALQLGIDVVALPVAVVKDATLIGPFLEDKEVGDATIERLKKIREHAKDVYDSLDEE